MHDSITLLLALIVVDLHHFILGAQVHKHNTIQDSLTQIDIILS